MTARPILFSGPMVRALLEGRKTQTRRAIKASTARGGFVLSFNHGTPEFNFGPDDRKPNGDLRWHRCPYGQPGDLLWVRETFQPVFADEWEEGRNPDGSGDRANYKTGEGYAPHYVADCGPIEFVTPDGDLVTRCTSPIHMPRWASRLTLRITDVRVQRLNDINGLDAVAEGLIDLGIQGARWHWERNAEWGYFAAWRAYRALWESINGPGSWAANPWVWAITFDVLQCNVDQVHP